MKIKDTNHVIAVVGTIRNLSREVLMINSPRNGWELPGGKVKGGEDLIHALEREIIEETGVKATIVKLVGIYSRIQAPPVVLFSFMGEYSSGELANVENSLAVEWVQAEEVIPRISNPAIRNAVEDLLVNNGKVVYRSYTIDPYRILNEYLI
ncbi:NUDIX hydrolase [bacterium]|nr:NUDIX hydrolase [bacterium]